MGRGNTQKISFPMPTAKIRFQILNLHPKKHVFKKTGLKPKNYTDFSDFAASSGFFTDFFDDLINIGLLPPPLKPAIPHGSSIVVFYKK